jgi:hypothetical protein
VRKKQFLARGILFLGSCAVALTVARPVLAQILGDADCPGGYSYNRAYGICVPYGSTDVPNNYNYANPYPPPFWGYGPYIVVTPGDRNRDRNRDQDRGRR